MNQTNEKPLGALAAAETRLSPHPWHEEIANTITHAGGLIAGIAATSAVIAQNQFRSEAAGIAFGLYASTLLAVYAASALSHGIWQPKVKYLLRVWDQGLIYLLIAGTYTPFVVRAFDGSARTVVLCAIWLLAGFGFTTKIWARHRINRLAVCSYVLLGWVPAMLVVPRLSVECFGWMAAGGVAYTLGTYFLKLDRARPFYHSIWHAFVIVGSACHFFAVVKFAS